MKKLALALGLSLLLVTAVDATPITGVKQISITDNDANWFYLEELDIRNSANVDVASLAFGSTAAANFSPAFGSTVTGGINDVNSVACCGNGTHSNTASAVPAHNYTITLPSVQTLDLATFPMTIYNRSDGCCPERVENYDVQFLDSGGSPIPVIDDVSGLPTNTFSINGPGDFDTTFGAGGGTITINGAGPPPAATLVAHYDFENGGSLGTDTSGLGNHATTVAGITQVAGRAPFTQAASFDEVNNRFEKAGGLTGYTSKPGFSFAAWVKRDAGDASFGGIVSQGNPVVNRLLLASSDRPYVDAGAHADFHFPTPTLTDGQWHHLVFTGADSGSNVDTQIFLDGSLPATHTFNSQQLTVFSGRTWVGSGEGLTSHPFQGLLDDVRIYEGVLSQAEVTALFNVPEPSTIVLAALGLLGLLGWRRRRRR